MKNTILFFCAFFLTPGFFHAAERAPYRLLFSNDTTNIASCPSSFNPDGKSFREEYIRHEVDEAAAADVEMLQPGLGWVPWWKSNILPMQEHVRWLEKTKQKPNVFDRYVLDGGDMVTVFVDQCRKKNTTPFISMRMNDFHHIFRGRNEPDPEKRLTRMAEFQWFEDHQDLLLGPGADHDSFAEYGFDFGRKEVRDYKFAFLQEIARNYDIDGLELDFMRNSVLFHREKTTVEQRRKIMLGFIRDVRSLLDQTARDGRRRWLCVRIPGYAFMWDSLGIEPKRWAEAGADMFNLSASYFTDFRMDLDKIRQELPKHATFYPELHFTTALHSQLPPLKPGDRAKPTVYRRTTEQQFYTAAHVAYSRGAGGVSLFNFHYYRCTRGPTDVYGTPAEPPFSIFSRLRDPDWLAIQPQHYVIAFTWFPPGIQKPFEKPFKVKDKPIVYTLDMAPPKDGWKKGGRLRIQSSQPLTGIHWTISMNGTKLEKNADVSEPYNNPYPEGRGEPDDFQAWSVPVSVLQDGINSFEISLDAAPNPSVRIFYLDVIVE